MVPAFLKVQGVIAIPESLQQSNHNSDYGQQTTSTIKIKLPTEDIFIAVVFMTLWNGIILVFTSSRPLILFFPPTWFGIALIYSILCMLFNSTIITITSSSVTVQQVTPISACDPFKSYALDDETVKEIRCKREVGSTGVDFYEVHIAREDGSSDKVLVLLRHVEEALFVAQEIERIMSIQDNEKTKIAGVGYDDDDVEWSLDGLAVT
jgi:hypothetical protein